MGAKFRTVRLIFNGLLNSILFRLIHFNGFNPNNTIMVFGSMRSGSTWLAEVISSVNGHLQIFEPLHPVYVPEAKEVIPEKIS